MKSKNLFLLSWKKSAIILILWIIAVMAHNFGSALIGFEEPVFFITATLIIPAYLVIAIIYSLIKTIKSQKKKRRQDKEIK